MPIASHVFEAKTQMLRNYRANEKENADKINTIMADLDAALAETPDAFPPKRKAEYYYEKGMIAFMRNDIEASGAAFTLQIEEASAVPDNVLAVLTGIYNKATYLNLGDALSNEDARADCVHVYQELQTLKDDETYAPSKVEIAEYNDLWRLVHLSFEGDAEDYALWSKRFKGNDYTVTATASGDSGNTGDKVVLLKILARDMIVAKRYDDACAIFSALLNYPLPKTLPLPQEAARFEEETASVLYANAKPLGAGLAPLPERVIPLMLLQSGGYV